MACWQGFLFDTIFAQFAHIDSIMNMGCNLIDMETASAFRAANLMKIPIAAIFSVSDNAIAKKSLMNEEIQDDRDYRRFVRKELIPKIILNLIESDESI